MTPVELQAIRERERRTTPGPWAVGQDEERASRPEFVHDTRGHVLFDGDEAEHDDLQFAAHARTDIPLLLAALEEQARELEERQRMVEHWTRCYKQTLDERDAMTARCERLEKAIRELDVPLPVVELTKLRDEVRADPDRLPVTLATAFDLGVKAARAALAGGEEG
jgi:DNA repair exonuclease SbcCD ATPase subunit